MKLYGLFKRRQTQSDSSGTRGYVLAWTLNVIAVLVMLSAIVSLSWHAQADEADDEFEDVLIDVTENSAGILDDADALLELPAMLADDLVAFAEDVTDESDADPAFCTQTARLAFVACGYEAADDFWGAQANCTNVSHPIDHADCRFEAYDAFDEEVESCEEVREAREDLCGDIGETRLEVQIDPDDFVNPADIGVTVDPNPYFPLIAGTMWTYEGDGEVIQVTVTEDVFDILGVPVVAVRDLVTEDGVEIEDTNDYFAQDVDGNVWYFGEIALNYEDGRVVDIDGSWQAGVDGAQPGIVMHASPMIGMVYRQEYLLSEAEDVGEVVDTAATELVPAAMCSGTCLVIQDSTPLEPGVTELKYFAPGIGLILETQAAEPEDDSEEEDEEDEDDEDDAVIRVELIEFVSP